MGPYLPRIRRDLDTGPRGQLSKRAGSISSSKLAVSGWGWGLHSVRGGVDQGDNFVRPLVTEISYM